SAVPGAITITTVALTCSCPTESGQRDFLYHNNGDGTFTKVTTGPIAADGGSARACSWIDYDNDGNLDLFVGGNQGPCLLYHNLGNGNHWLELKCIGTRSNRTGIGAKIRVEATFSGKLVWQSRQITGGDGLYSNCALVAHFGLGDAQSARLARIEWPSGTVQELADVPSDQILTITEAPNRVERPTLSIQGIAPPTFLIRGVPGVIYRLQISGNLPNWIDVTTISLHRTQGQTIASDPSGLAAPWAFYRLEEIPLPFH
ncbi:MAG: ASPIC/UnbV domain-containing protein, partial [Verrucomicrobia bacterium]|nr:ASPIC/UnbV domain-containing protein [Verrucomicrobiota bacterium]